MGGLGRVALIWGVGWKSAHPSKPRLSQGLYPHPLFLALSARLEFRWELRGAWCPGGAGSFLEGMGEFMGLWFAHLGSQGFLGPGFAGRMGIMG